MGSRFVPNGIGTVESKTIGELDVSPAVCGRKNPCAPVVAFVALVIVNTEPGAIAILNESPKFFRHCSTSNTNACDPTVLAAYGPFPLP